MKPLIRAAQDSDLDAILALEAAFAPTERWSRQSWGEELNHCHVLVAHQPAVVAVASFRLIVDEVELDSVVVADHLRRTGLATRLISEGMKWAKSQGAGRILLEVALDNEAASNLYSKLGFVKLSRRKNYYGSGRDALVMTKDL